MSDLLALTASLPATTSHRHVTQLRAENGGPRDERLVGTVLNHGYNGVVTFGSLRCRKVAHWEAHSS